MGGLKSEDVISHGFEMTERYLRFRGCKTAFVIPNKREESKHIASELSQCRVRVHAYVLIHCGLLRSASFLELILSSEENIE